MAPPIRALLLALLAALAAVGSAYTLPPYSTQCRQVIASGINIRSAPSLSAAAEQEKLWMCYRIHYLGVKVSADVSQGCRRDGSLYSAWAAWSTGPLPPSGSWLPSPALPSRPTLPLTASQGLDWSKIWWMGKERWIAAKYLAYCGATACKAVSAGGRLPAARQAGLLAIQLGARGWCALGMTRALLLIMLPQTDAATCQRCLAAKSLLKRAPELSSSDAAASEGACLAW